MLRYLRPSRLIEAGSGASSAVALDTFDRFFPKRPKCTFIDPNPGFLKSFLNEHDRNTVEIIETGIQDVPLSRFDVLQRNDVLFID